ncbi:MAG: hypothetical protein QME68_02990 [Elusimicrobiota bacterium]|nr:hypothetical protein [Elusimicrobiota bacterium]
MEILGISLTLLGVIFAYIWRANGKIQQQMMSMQEKMMQALERIEQGQEKGFAILAEMLLNQTKILERIEKKLP